jgi:GNAT superfamily N-acetyltransferase
MNPSHQTTLFEPHNALAPGDCTSVPQTASCSYDLSELTRTDDSALSSHTISKLAGFTAASDADAVKLVSNIFNESFGFRPDGKPYRLGPKSVSERLLSTDYLFIAGDTRSGVGYLFGKEISSSAGRVAWIESMAVLPLYRRQGIATALVRSFVSATKAAPFVGFATPNPIAGHVITRCVPGNLYIGRCFPPFPVYQMLKEIQDNCFDLRGCALDKENLLIKTGFSPLSRSDERQWAPREAIEAPKWWTFIEHLPNAFEALVVIKR